MAWRRISSKAVRLVDWAGKPGNGYGWAGNTLIKDTPLRLDSTIGWDRAECWHDEPGSFRPLAKQEAPRQVLNAEGKYEEHPGRLAYVVADHLGTPRELFDEKGHKQWAAEYRLWGAEPAMARRARQRRYDISRADMSHINDASTWWNQTGRYFGERAPLVRQFMLEPNNYYLDLDSINRSQGEILGKNTRYLPPVMVDPFVFP
ncbi:RHS domain-containing protein [Labrys sp. LIt4]|nr:RHS domain-containing protein [Labrys sp. LIt4]